jgi:hypothetical protein
MPPGRNKTGTQNGPSAFAPERSHPESYRPLVSGPPPPSGERTRSAAARAAVDYGLVKLGFDGVASNGSRLNKLTNDVSLKTPPEATAPRVA